MAGDKGNPKWVKGQSGNPGGRPKADYRIRDLAKEKTKIALDTLSQICESGENEGARVAAATALLDRGWGKPTQMIEANVTHAVAADLTDEELIDIARRSSDGAAEEAGGAQDTSELH
jgi:hypothetical protein